VDAGRGAIDALPVCKHKGLSPRLPPTHHHHHQERDLFEKRFVRVEINRLCELAAAADTLEIRPVMELASRAIARLIEGKSPEQIREVFKLPDDLTEEEKLAPFTAGTGAGVPGMAVGYGLG
jgi:hypothetical protein